jgi:hypothetical protein
MRKQIVGLVGALACMVGLAPAAWSVELTKDYLAGTWGVGGADACSLATTEKITFDPKGSFTNVRGDKVTATGFWHLVEDNLDLHMVTSLAFFDDPTTTADDQLSDFAGQYNYLYAKALLFDVEQDSFRAVAAMGNILRGANYHRCP